LAANYIPPPNKAQYYEAVWALVCSIPDGKVATYGQIMKRIGKPDFVSDEDYKMSASRWVGMAMSACPKDVPWHRVVNSQGKISHQSGADEQQRRLQQEGIVFLGDRVDLKTYQWSDGIQSDAPVQESLF